MTKTVLYIEDNQVNVELMRRVMKTVYGLDIESTTSATVGIDKAREMIPTVILLDINLPDMNGLEAAGHLREIEALNKTPIIGLSANSMEQDIQKAMDAGFDAYLTKPLNLPEVIAMLNQYLT